MEFILWCAILAIMALAVRRCLREDAYDITLDDALGALGDIPNTGRQVRVTYTYLLTNDEGHVTHGAIEYDEPAQVHQHWVGPIVKVTREWTEGSE